MDKPRLRTASTPGEVVLKVDHAGEHGAVSIYRAQRWVARWRAPSILEEVEEFIAHEQRHRSLFAAELERRGVRRCRSYHLCGLGGLALGLFTGLIGPRAIALTTEAVESVVLRHLQHQLATLSIADPVAVEVIRQIVRDEQEHHDRSAARLSKPRALDRLLAPAVRAATETVIWLGMWPKPLRRFPQLEAVALRPVLAEDAHDEGVADAAVDRAVVVAEAAFDDEAELLVGAAGALVLDEQVEVDAVGLGLGVEPVER